MVKVSIWIIKYCPSKTPKIFHLPVVRKCSKTQETFFFLNVYLGTYSLLVDVACLLP